MTKNYQNKTASVAIAVEAAMPDAVSVTLAELAVSLREGLLALAVGTGFQVMDAVIDESVSVLAGPRGRHDQNRTAVRHGTEDGSVVLGGRRVPVRRPRVRTADRSAEVAVPAYELFSSTDVLSAMVLERMMAKLSTRCYAAGLEPVGAQVEATARSTSKSAISRRFVAATETALGDMLADLRDRGLNTTRPILCVLDGAKALSAGVQAVFDHPVIQRCQLHKIRNVEAKLPDNLASTVAKKMRAAYHNPDALAAEATLEGLARQLDKNHPGAAGSLREGLAQTLTITRLGVPPTLARTLRSTNAVESMIEICRDHSTNVKRWRDGQMALRWCAAGM